MSFWKGDPEPEDSNFEEMKKRAQDLHPALLFEIEAYSQMLLAALGNFPEKTAYTIIQSVTSLVNSYDDQVRRQIAYCYALLPLIPPDVMETWNLVPEARSALSVLKKIAHVSIREAITALKTEPVILEMVQRNSEIALRHLADELLKSPMDSESMANLVILKKQYDSIMAVSAGPDVPEPVPQAIDEDALDGTESPEGLNFKPNI